MLTLGYRVDLRIGRRLKMTAYDLTDVLAQMAAEGYTITVSALESASMK